MGDTGLHLQLLQEIQSLRETVDELRQTLGKCHRISLRPVEAQVFLGQPVTMIAKVMDAAGRAPRGDAPVTFTTSWGKLRCADGYTAQEAKTVTARTNLDGTIRLTLLPSTSEELWDVQASALESMLRRLDPGAPTPQADLDGFIELARQYRWEANINFRRAVDIYFRDFQRRAMETVNTHDHMARWRSLDATIVAYVRDGESEDDVQTSVWGTAALTLQFKDWLGPLLQAHLDLLKLESPLGRDLVRIKDLEKDTGRLVETVYERIRDYVSGQRGLLGETAGRTVSQAAIGGFLETDIGDLPLETRVGLFPSLQAAAGTLGKAGVSVLSGLGQARTELKNDLNSAIGQIETGKLGPMRDQIRGFETQLADRPDRNELTRVLVAKADVSALQNVTTTVSENLRTLGDRLGGMELQMQGKVGRTELTQALAGKVDRTAFDGFRTEVNASLRTKVDSTTFERFQIDVNDRLGKKVGIDAFESGMTRTHGALDGKTDKTAFDALRVANEQSLNTKVDLTQFRQQQLDVKNALATKAETSELSRLQNDVNVALRSKVDTSTFKSFSTEVNESLLAKVDNTTFGRFQTDVNSRLRGRTG